MEPPRNKDRAAALQYADPRELPRVLAGGSGEIARQIVALAEQHGIPVQQNSELAEMLSRVGEGQQISPESYRLVAEVISFLYHTDKEWQQSHSQLEPVLGKSESR